MTIGFTKKILVLGASATILALGGAPAGFAGEDDGPTANGEQVGGVLDTSGSSGGSSGGSSSGSSNGSSNSATKAATKSAQKTLVAKRDTAVAQGGVQAGFGGMANTPGENLLFSLLLGFGGVAMLGAAKLAPLNRRNDR